MPSVQTLQEELRQKDKMIDQLRKENLEILHNALRQSEENEQLRERLQKLKKNNI